MDNDEIPTLSAKDYLVGCICASPPEMAAVRAMLDTEHSLIDNQDLEDKNFYAFGRINRHNVVIACLLSGVPGTSSAASVARDMLRTFKSLRFGLMVGIGSGIPIQKKHDIRLGDVVVSQPEGRFGGVIQYDLGTVSQGESSEEEFLMKGSLNSPPNILLSALSEFEAAYIQKGSQISTYVTKMTQRDPRMQELGYGFPGILQDNLYQSTYLHESEADGCESCDQGQKTQRKPVSLEPRIHFGTIASGNQAIRDAIRRDKLGVEHGALCIDMEAAGLMNHFPCLVIRGISDYADSHANDVWQGYAASTAAAFAKEFLLCISPEAVSSEKPFKVADEELRKVAADQLVFGQKNLGVNESHLELSLEELEVSQQHLASCQKQAEQQQPWKQSREYQDCLRAFNPASSYEQQKDINPGRNPRTCKWVLNDERYQRWYLSQKNDLLWISADPGCGKSVLSRSLVDIELQSTSSHTVCYFFFKDNQDQDKLSIALSAILHQLFSQRMELLRHAIDPWRKNGHIQQEVSQLWEILMKAAADSDTSITCVFDALDECIQQDRENLIERLATFYQDSQKSEFKSHLKFLVTSRPYSDISSQFEGIPPDLPLIRSSGELENDAIQEEIAMVICDWTKTFSQTVKLKSAVLEKLQNKLLGFKHRTYLWLHLVIKDIEEFYQESLDLDSESINSLPASVEQAYERILKKVSPENQKAMETIFHLVLAAKRPLSVTELAMMFKLNMKLDVNQYASLQIEENVFEKKIQQLCGLFVFIKHSAVYLIHQTAREFLLSSGDTIANGTSWMTRLDPKTSSKLIGYACMKYILLEDLRHHIHTYDRDIGQFRDDSSSPGQEESDTKVVEMLDYAARYWPVHFRECDEAQELRDLAFHLYDTGGSNFCLWFNIYWQVVLSRTVCYQHTGSIDLDNISVKVVAALNGHENMLRTLIMERDDINLKDFAGVTVLAVVAGEGHHNITRLLLDKGADANTGVNYYQNPLQLASLKGHLSVALLLIEQGADVNAQGGHYGNALQAAASSGHISMVQLLIEKGADINAQGGYYFNALQAALFTDNLSIVNLLIEKGADINADVGRYGSALQTALFIGNLSIAQLLIEKGADVNVLVGEQGSALRIAFFKGYLSIFKLLIEKGADINAQGMYRGTLLQAAAAMGNLQLAQLLIEHGADVNAHARDLGSPLQIASFRGHVSVVQLLIEKGADINAHGEYHGTALQAAANLGNLQLVQLLIEKGADINAHPGDDGSPLQIASFRGHLPLVQLLIEKGADRILGKGDLVMHDQ